MCFVFLYLNIRDSVYCRVTKGGRGGGGREGRKEGRGGREGEKEGGKDIG